MTEVAPTHLPVVPIDLLRPGSGDRIALLCLWIVRQFGNTLLVLGFIPLIVAGEFNPTILARLDTPGEVLRAMLSPLIILAVAILLRTVASLVAIIAAFPRAPIDRFDPARTPARGRVMRGFDTFHLARARSSMRWTWAVRRTAAVDLGNSGTILEGLGRVASFAMVPAMVLVVLAMAWFD